MNEETKQAAQTIGRLKRKASDEERLQGWRETCAEQGLSGEFILTAKLNGAAYTEEEACRAAQPSAVPRRD